MGENERKRVCLFSLDAFFGLLVIKLITNLFECIPQLFDSNHVCSFSQHLRTHQFHKVFKVHSATAYREREQEAREAVNGSFVDCAFGRDTK